MQGYNTWDQYVNPQHMTAVYTQGGLPSSQKKELHLYIFPLSNFQSLPSGSWWLTAQYSLESQVALYRQTLKPTTSQGCLAIGHIQVLEPCSLL